MSENDQSRQFGQGAQPPAEPPGQPPPTPPVAPQPPAANTSGTSGPVPEEIKGWNWGAFWLTWIWGIAHNVWISLLVFCLWPIWMIVLGIKGNEWAWLTAPVRQHRAVQADSGGLVQVGVGNWSGGSRHLDPVVHLGGQPGRFCMVMMCCG